jgi:hypothetical protein
MIDRTAWKRILVCLAAAALATAYLLRPRPVPVEEAARETDCRREATLERIDAKFLLMEEVTAGRMSLLEAAAHFRALNLAAVGKNWDRYRKEFPGATDEERHCREVLRWVQSIEAFDPCLWLAVSTRMERELQAALAAGPIRLPTPTSVSRPVADRPGG